MKIFENFWFAFLKMDLLGKKPKFTIARQKTFQTELGTIATFISFGFIFYFVLFFGKEIFLRQLPSVVTTSTYDDIPYPVNISDNKFEIALALQTRNYTPFIKESVYKPKAYLIKTKRINGLYETTKKELPLIKCSDNKFSELHDDYYQTLPLENLYCLQSKNDLVLTGEFDREEWTYLSIDFMICDIVSDKNCAQKKEINDVLYGGYLGIFIIDLSVSPNNYQNPVKYFGKNLFTSYSVKDFREVWFYLKTIEINTNVGILFNSIEHKSYYAFDNIRETMHYTCSNDFLSLKIRGSQTRTIIDRSYMKVQTLCAYVGGIIKFILLVAEILVYWFREILYKDYILNFYSTNKCSYQNLKNKYKSSTIILSQKNEKRNNSLFSAEKVNSIMINKQNNNEQSFAMFVQENHVLHHSIQLNFPDINNKNGKSKKKNNSNNINRKIILESKSYQNNKKSLIRDILGPCLCNKSIKKRITQIKNRYNNIAINFDIITYLKLLNEVFILKTQLLNSTQMKLSEIGYHFEFETSLDVNYALINYQ